ncbi:SNF2 family N-terminal domain-containing protein [Rhodocollybia butyracea]|uniref:SNF2 family N-terminal domain-containing protein n=1 Tax=Rhodocollybia butyracea TaxID=206335 RepID=A0A9P5PXE9_9AGAR|nr:SNF2 family N-terminal domain-containing protein [Rhodocollybia butyracea]
MPSFQPLTGKRKSNAENSQSPGPDTLKRPRLENRPVLNDDGHYWMVQWRNHQSKKHKTWEGDGVLVVNSGTKATLFDATDGKQIGAGKAEPPFSNGKLLNVGGKDVELDKKITQQEYLSGIYFGSNSALVAQSATKSAPTQAFRPLTFRKLDTESVAKADSSVSSSSACSPLPERNDHIDRPNDEILPPSFWVVNWRKAQSTNKKQIIWEGDAFISCVSRKITMISEEGKVMGTSPCKNHQHQSGDHCYLSGKELVLLNEVSNSQIPLIPPSELSLTDVESPCLAPPLPAPPAPTNRYIPPSSFYATLARPKKSIGPLHDPSADDAVVMKEPNKEHIERYNKKDRPVIPVVLDPILARQMRPHQREGVKFMYECIMGLRKHEGQGCILADEMGLGKTLQTISLIWTLLRQNPYAGAGPIASKVLIVCPVSLINNWKAEFHKWLGRDRVGVSVCDKNVNVVKTFASSARQQVLIVGYERLRIVMKEIATCGIGLVVCDEGHRLKSAKAKTSTIFQQLNTLKRIILSGTPIQNDLSEFHSMVDFCNPGLLDEYSAFRRLYEIPILKSRAPGCTVKELELGEKRSAQLTNVARSFVLRREATILGNYLPPKHEYVVFVTPTSLQLSIFAKVLDPNKVDDFVESSSTAESLALINTLTMISSSPILLKAAADKERSKNNSDGGGALRCNNIHEALKLLPSNCQIEDLTLSATKSDKTSKKEASSLFLVSSTSIVLREEKKNVFWSLITLQRLTFWRVTARKCIIAISDWMGKQTPAAKRQEYVNTFNKTNQKTSFIFLLSSKAGGTGINLIGASRLCLIDSDWNPSHDLQAMARCHRDGQKRPVFIYRFLTAGTIDEKIYQRQIIKLGLSSALMGSDNKSKADSFTRKDLRDIFRVDPYTSSNTHDLLECFCDNDGEVENDSLEQEHRESRDNEPDIPKGFIAASQVKPSQEMSKIDQEYLDKKKSSLAALEEWKHINCLKPSAVEDVKDELLRNMLYVKPKEESSYLAKTKTEQILAAIDLDNLAEREGTTPRTVPGGTVSFLFERSCSVSVKPEDTAKEEDGDEGINTYRD